MWTTSSDLTMPPRKMQLTARLLIRYIFDPLPEPIKTCVRWIILSLAVLIGLSFTLNFSVGQFISFLCHLAPSICT